MAHIVCLSRRNSLVTNHIHVSSLASLSKYSVHKSSCSRFPLSDYNVFWLREPRKWDFIEFGNHPEMYPLQKVDKMGIRKLKGRFIPHNEKERLMSDDTFNREWEIYPWAHSIPTHKVDCILQSENEIIDFEIPRWVAEQMKRNLRNRCTIYDLTILKPKALSMTPHQLIAQSWKTFGCVNANLKNENESKNMSIEEKIEQSINENSYSSEMIDDFYGLTTKTRENHLCFLKDIKKRFIFDDVEQLVFEKWEPFKARNVVIPIRFYGLTQWFRSDRTDQWHVCRKICVRNF